MAIHRSSEDEATIVEVKKNKTKDMYGLSLSLSIWLSIYLAVLDDVPPSLEEWQLYILECMNS